MNHAIITSSDARYGGFLIDHWLASLRDNVTLEGIEVAVLDYGLTPAQRGRLGAAGVLCHPCVKDGNITNIRYRDLGRFLSGRQYDQVLSVDGGDVIFQADIRHLFDQDKESFRAVCDEVHIPLHEAILPRADVDPETFDRIFYFLKGKQRVNGGVILGPAAKFRGLWEDFQRLMVGYQVFGTDQYVMNYLLYQQGFVRLESKYNFVILSVQSRYSIRGGVFYDRDRQVIPVVHNAGMRSLTRCIGRFGYGKGRNRKKRLVYFLLSTFFRVANWINRRRGYV